MSYPIILTHQLQRLQVLNPPSQQLIILFFLLRLATCYPLPSMPYQSPYNHVTVEIQHFGRRNSEANPTRAARPDRVVSSHLKSQAVPIQAPRRPSTSRNPQSRTESSRQNGRRCKFSSLRKLTVSARVRVKGEDSWIV